MGKKKVLFVDDEPMIVKIMKSRLEANNYEVFTALSGQEAIELALGQKPDLILLDILMPDLNGYEVCGRLKSNPRTKEIPVIMFTALQEDECKERSEEMGAVEIIRKPFVGDLVRAIRKVFEQEFSSQ
ncbi:MAG: response regulator [Candidatus Omnitrophota bacterium]|nr:response regulator [Candidatus Omnitrophota bacterium]